MFFSQLTLLSNTLFIIITSNLSGIYLESFLVTGRNAENTEEKKKRDRRKTLKIEEKDKQRIRGKSNNNNIHLWF